mgnify:CR=1 FL=1
MDVELTLRGISAAYGKHTVLEAVDVDTLEGGQLVGLLGPNASGKTTLTLQAIADGGRCTWFLTPANPVTARKRWIAAMKPRGELIVDEGAARALADGRSLLPAGVRQVKGVFHRGDPVLIRGPQGAALAQGLARYGHTALAREMGIRKILVSKLASGLCAFGQILSDVKYNYMAPAPIRLEGAKAAARLDSLFNELEARGRADLAEDGFADKDITIRRSLDMRYVGQVHECTVDVDPFEVNEASLDRLKAAFHARHEELYTYAEPQSPVEIVNVESAITGGVPCSSVPDTMSTRLPAIRW